MDTIRKYDARNLTSAHQKKSEHSFRQMGSAFITNSSGTRQDGTQADRRTFAEDFLKEHSNSGRNITLIGIAGSYGAAPKKMQPSAQSFGFPS
jgi:23S rRNA pseudoU1915 N3-methylase RlmH